MSEYAGVTRTPQNADARQRSRQHGGLDAMEELLNQNEQARWTARIGDTLHGIAQLEDGEDNPEPSRRRNKRGKAKEKKNRSRAKEDKQQQRTGKRYLKPFLVEPQPERGAKHDRRNRRMEKFSGTLFDSIPDESISAVNEELLDLDEENLSDDEEEQVSDVDDRDEDIIGVDENEGKRAPKKKVQKEGKVTQPEIAEEFSKAMAEKGFNVYLSGGSAISYQGGPREPGDLDFRLSMQDAGFSSFNEPKGRALLTYINRVVMPNSRSKHKNVPGSAHEFLTIGKGNSLTIGTTNWFGVELSLSLVYFQPTELVNLREEASGEFADSAPDVKALSLTDLRSDKIKSLITRRKSGEENVKKIAKDLFDYLTTVKLLSESGEVNKEAMADSLKEATGGKLGEYSFVSHDQTPWMHVPDEDVAELMQARAVMTAQSHGRQGPRRVAFLALAEQHEPRVEEEQKESGKEEIEDQIPKSRAARKAWRREQKKLREAEKKKRQPTEMERMLDMMVDLPVSGTLRKALKPWFKQWNQGPNFAPPKPFKKLSGPRLRGKERGEPGPNVRSGFEILDDIEAHDERAEEGNQPAYLEGIGDKSLNETSVTILKVLSASDGFRALGKIEDMATLEAFGLTKAHFNRGWSPLQKAGYVAPSEEGATLTPKGKALIENRD
jgi:hypothetical protein